MKGNRMIRSAESQLEILVRLAAVQLVGERTGADAILVLAKAGLDTDLIAEVVDTTPATVRAALSRARRADPGTRKRGGSSG